MLHSLYISDGMPLHATMVMLSHESIYHSHYILNKKGYIHGGWVPGG
jgi:hypothetical protein